MLNLHSFQTVQSLQFGKNFQKPAYGSYCFAHIPDTIRRLFSLPSEQPLPDFALPDWKGYKNVIFMFIDGLGWRFLDETGFQHPFLKEITSNGLISQITSMFPSTTAAHTACIHTGSHVAQNGIHEWYYYEPEVDQVISPLMFSFAEEKTREQLTKIGYKASQFFPSSHLYHDLLSTGVQVNVLNHREFAHSSFSRQVCSGAKISSFTTVAEALVNVRLILEQPSPQSKYIFLYIPNFDTILHYHGPGSPQARAELNTWLDQMNYFLASLRSIKDTLLMISADHGQSEVNPQTTVYINNEIPDLVHFLKTNRQGDPILFGGSPRDLFLYIQDQHLLKVKTNLEYILKDRAEVFLTSDLIQQGIFGSVQDYSNLTSRMGNLVILPQVGESVMWFKKGVFEQEYFGHHGGLSPQEMLIPFIAYPLR